MQPPPFGWPVRLSALLNNKFPDAWAYTGSFAMYCHAELMNRNCRTPQDIDIIVKKSVIKIHGFSASSAFQLMCDIAEDFNCKYPMGNFGSTHGRLVNCAIEQSQTPVDIDVGTESSSYGLIDQNTMIYSRQAVPWRIMTAGKLLSSKEASTKTEGTKEQDIETLKSFLALTII